MKTVSGKVLSCKPVSISKAAKVLSKFVSTDNGASPAFAAYLRRASASFSELAQLHKEQKSSGSRHKVKKQHSHGAVTEGTFESVITQSKDGLLAKDSSTSKRKEVRGVSKSEGEAGSIEVDGETRRHKSKNRGEEDEGKHNARGSAIKMEVQESDAIADGNAEIVRGAGKKSKIKRENSESGAVTIKDQPYSDHHVVNSSELKNKETKKKKRESIESGKHDVAADIKKEVLKDKVDAQAIENEKSHSGKKKKHKKDQHHGDHAAVNSTKVNNEVESFDGSKDGKKEKKRDKPEKEKSDDPLDMEKEKKQKKKRTHEERDMEFEGKLEIEAANNRQRKRKHESVVDEGLENSQEKHKSKKKKRCRQLE